MNCRSCIYYEPTLQYSEAGVPKGVIEYCSCPDGYNTIQENPEEDCGGYCSMKEFLKSTTSWSVYHDL